MKFPILFVIVNSAAIILSSSLFPVIEFGISFVNIFWFFMNFAMFLNENV